MTLAALCDFIHSSCSLNLSKGWMVNLLLFTFALQPSCCIRMDLLLIASYVVLLSQTHTVKPEVPPSSRGRALQLTWGGESSFPLFTAETHNALHLSLSKGLLRPTSQSLGCKGVCSKKGSLVYAKQFCKDACSFPVCSWTKGRPTCHCGLNE